MYVLQAAFIEDVRQVLHVFWLFIPLPVFWALYDQQVCWLLIKLQHCYIVWLLCIASLS